jgi:hypothetical protein
VSAVHDVIGSLVMTAKDHELIAKSLKSSASMYRKLAGNQRSRVRADEDLEAAAVACDGAADGHTFRARELRYDANGGMTEEQATMAFAPGATWTLYGEPLTVESNDANGVRLDHPGRQDGLWARASAMTREHGWKLVALAGEPARDANGGHALPGGWP